MPTIVVVVAVVVVLAFLLVTSTVKIVQEYERGVIFRLGRLVGARGPGLFLLIPGAERMRKVDVRIVTPSVRRPRRPPWADSGFRTRRAGTARSSFTRRNRGHSPAAPDRSEADRADHGDDEQFVFPGAAS